MHKKVIASIAVAALGLFVAWRIVAKVGQGKGSGRRGGAVAVAVEVGPVQRSLVREIGRFTGSLSPRSRYVVAPKIAGRLERLTVDVGDPVKSGQLIAELDAGEYAQQVEQARAELAVAKASVAETRSALDVAARDMERAEALHDKKVASDSELDAAKATLAACDAKHQVALAEVSRREAALKAAEVRLSYTRIEATWRDSDAARVIGERFLDEGEMLTPNTPIVSILDNSAVIAAIDVIARDYPKIKVGQQAVITTDGFPGREFTGDITRIAPLLKELSRQGRVEIEIPNADGLLKPGMFIRAEVEFTRHENVSVVPTASLVRREGKQGVFLALLDEQRARFVPVTVGIIDGNVAEIVEPELSGNVVTLGHHLLEDGSAIRLPERDAVGAGVEPDGKDGAVPGEKP